MPRRRRSHGYRRWSPYVPIARRRRNSARVAARLRDQGRDVSPVEVVGRGTEIATTFWGSSWCENLERYSDFSNRLPRGRTYVRNGSVIDLQIAPGKVSALVSGSEIYSVEVQVARMGVRRWKALCRECGGGIDSVVELLEGRFSRGVMEVLCREGTGMFPAPREISMSCSCPDWADMCKHVAATLYGIGVRLDQRAEVLFELRQVDGAELVRAAAAGAHLAPAEAEPAGAALAGMDLSELFGIDLDGDATAPQRPVSPLARGRGRGRRNGSATSRPARSGKTRPASPGAKRSGSSRKTGRRKKPSKRPRPAATAEPWITAKELTSRGVPHHKIQSWLNSGALEHSGERGVYLRGPRTEDMVAEYLARRGRRRTRARRTSGQSSVRRA